MNIEKTKWAKNFKEQCSYQYAEAIKIATDPTLRVAIFLSTELEEPVWAVSAMRGDMVTDFWLDAFPTLELAKKLCKAMKWGHVEYGKDISQHYEWD